MFVFCSVKLNWGFRHAPSLSNLKSMTRPSLELLRQKIDEVVGARLREYFPFSLVPAGIPRSAIIEVRGSAATTFICRFLSQTPNPEVIWVQDKAAVYPRLSSNSVQGSIELRLLKNLKSTFTTSGSPPAVKRCPLLLLLQRLMKTTWSAWNFLWRRREFLYSSSPENLPPPIPSPFKLRLNTTQMKSQASKWLSISISAREWSASSLCAFRNSARSPRICGGLRSI